MISDRPIVLTVDDQNRPHNDDGPFCKWSDGSALYAVHGTRCPVWIIDYPVLITMQDIESESNAEVRRIMIDRYKRGESINGIAAYLIDSGSKIVDVGAHDHKVPGLRGSRLMTRDIPGDETAIVLELRNSTPEPDGSIKLYHFRIDPRCYAGESAKNVWAAAASMCREYNDATKLAFLDYHDYTPDVET